MAVIPTTMEAVDAVTTTVKVNRVMNKRKSMLEVSVAEKTTPARQLHASYSANLKPSPKATNGVLVNPASGSRLPDSRSSKTKNQTSNSMTDPPPVKAAEGVPVEVIAEVATL